MERFAIRSERIVCPGNVDADGYLLVEDGLLKGLTEVAPEGAEIVDRRGCWVAPGFVDTHIHGYAGHDVMDCDPAGVTEICQELARRGTTSWLATTLTASVEQTGEACASVAAAVHSQGSDFIGARTQGIFLEGPFFTEAHKGAQNPKYLIDPVLETLDAWQEQADGLIRKSALAPERAGSVEYIRVRSAPSSERSATPLRPMRSASRPCRRAPARSCTPSMAWTTSTIARRVPRAVR